MAAAASLLLISGRPSAHEVPSELTIEVFLKPVQSTLQVLIRIPLSGLMGTGMPKEGIGYLALDHIQPSLQQTAVQIANAIDIREGAIKLPAPRVVQTRISLPFDASFASYDKAIAHMLVPPLPVDTQVYWLQGYFDGLLEYPIRSDLSSFSIRSGLMVLAPQVTTRLQFLPPDRSVRSFEFVGDPGRVWLDPHRYQAARAFFTLGFLRMVHVWEQWMFVLCILIPCRRVIAIAPAMTSFGVAYTLTSLIVAYGPDSTGTWLPALVQTITAGLLVLLAFQNIAVKILGRRLRTAAAFGVVSGVSYSLAMRGVAQFGGRHPLWSLLSFDVGIGFGQLLTVVLVSVSLTVIARFFVAEGMRTIILSALVANVTWNSFTQRAAQLPDLQWPLPTPANLVTATSWLLVFVLIAGCLWLLAGLRRPQERREPLDHGNDRRMNAALQSTEAIEH